MRMLRQVGLLSLVVGLTVAACDDDPEGPAPEVYVATMNGANESPAVTTTATGTGTFTVTGNTIAYSITISTWPSDRTVSAHHIHFAPVPPATTGGVLLGWPAGSITTTGGSGTIAVSDAQLVSIRAGGTYFNVHSSINGGGEIRGNLVRQ